VPTGIVEVGGQWAMGMAVGAVRWPLAAGRSLIGQQWL
jgi:hypothetical protein